MRRLAIIALLVACNRDPGEIEEGVGYRDPTDDGASSGERGTVKISEVLWSGSVDDDGKWDPADVFVELRNESNRPLDLTDWRLVLDGTEQVTWRIPDLDREVLVGEHIFLAAKTSGCFPDADGVLSGLAFPYDDPFTLTLRDSDERLIEGMGAKDEPPFAGGYDLVRSRSMERVQLIFGGDGGSPESWHFYTPAEVDVPNDDRIGDGCRDNTLASPGRPNSPDYSGAYASGSFE